MTPRLAGRSARRAAFDGVEVVGHAVTSGTGACAVIRCGDLDVRTLAPEAALATQVAMERLLRSLTGDLRFIAQIRPLTDDGRGTAPSANAGPHRCTVLAVVSAPAPGAALDRELRCTLDGLAQMGVDTRVLRDDELRHCVAVAWSGDPSLQRPPWASRAGHARSGGLLLRAVRLRRLPGTPVESGWLAPLLGVRAACDVVIGFHPLDARAVMNRLHRRLRMLRADQLGDAERELVGDAHVEAGADAALDLRDRIARNEGRPLSLTVVAVARARQQRELDSSCDALRRAFAATLAEDGVAHFEHLALAEQSWPVPVPPPPGKLVDSVAAATCMPWTRTTCDDPGGYHLGVSTADDLPVRIAPFDTDRHVNGNIAILAASGQGKSHTCGVLLHEARRRGIDSVIVDPEGEHGRLVTSLDGEFLPLAPGCGTAFNVFEAGAGDDHDRRADVAAAVTGLVDLLCGGRLGEVERAHIEAAALEALDRAAAEGRAATLGDCLPDLERTTPRIVPVVRRLCTGPLATLFDRPTNACLEAPAVGLSLRDLPDELVPAAALVVAAWLWALVRRSPRDRHIVFDEVGALCVHPPLRALLVQLARRCRKYRASLVVATQNATDLLSTDEGTVVATNPAIVLLGGHRGAETARMQAAYALTDRQRRALETAGRGEFLLVAGRHRLPVRIRSQLAGRHRWGGPQPAPR